MELKEVAKEAWQEHFAFTERGEPDENFSFTVNAHEDIWYELECILTYKGTEIAKGWVGVKECSRHGLVKAAEDFLSNMSRDYRVSCVKWIDLLDKQK